MTEVAQKDTSGYRVPARSLSARLFLGIIASLLTVLAIEGAARIYAHVTNQVRGMTFDSELGWRPIPHVKKQGGVWGATRPASTNSQGWRDAERSFAKAPGVRRVVAIGDSFTFGTEVNDGERFTDLLQESGLEIVNMGVAGYGPDQELRVLQTEVFKYDPDLILVTSCVKNDLEDLTYERLYSWPKPSYVLDGGALRLRKPSKTWDVTLRTRSYLVETMFQKFWNEDLRPRSISVSGADSPGRVFEELVAQMAQFATSRSVPVVAALAYVPDSGDPAADQNSALMKRAFDRAGIPWLDTRDLLRRRSATPDTSYYAPGATHWNASGHAIVAEGVRGLVKSALSR